MNINQAFPSKHLKASDLQDKTVLVTITEVKLEEVGRDKEMKLVAYFEGKTKGMVLNKTNSKKIAEIADSNETDEWVGKTIAIYPTETTFDGDTVECIRVKQPRAAAATGPKVVSDDAVGF